MLKYRLEISVAAAEAAFGCEAVVNPVHSVFLKHRIV
jgi:hypothetical protein